MDKRINAYRCEKCGGLTVTIDVDNGVTPFMLKCRASGKEDECSGFAQSSFYRPPPNCPPPAWEWYRLTDAEARKQERQFPGSWDHHRQGGLSIRYRPHATRSALNGKQGRLEDRW